MAEGGLDLPVYTGSDIVYDFFCELCIEDGRQVEAEGYCQDCGEYLCGSCYGGHRKSRPTRHHVLQDKDSMPRDTPLAQDRVSRDIATKCKIHTGEPMKYYCRSHKDLGCASCFVIGHRGCTDIENIMDASGEILDNCEYQGFIRKVQSMRRLSRDIKARARNNRTVSQKCCDDVVASVREQKEEAIRSLHEREHDIVTLVEQMRSEDDEKMASVVEQSDELSEKIEQLSSEIESLQSSKRVCQLYITMRETEPDVTSMQRSLRQLERNNVVRGFRFEPNADTAPRLLSTPDFLGKITHETQHAREARQIIPTRPYRGRATSVVDINVKLRWDQEIPYISGLAAIPHNTLVIADLSNRRVKLIDTNKNTLMSELRVSCPPNDITMISNTQAVVTLEENRTLLFVMIIGLDMLVKYRQIHVGENCKGVACSQDKLLVTYSHDPRLEIMDLYGNLIRTIEYSSDGISKLFHTPSYVCVSQDGKTVYVSDECGYNVTSLTMAGEVKAVYTDSELLVPQKICTDQRGNVYICGGDSSNIHMVTADCRKVEVIPVLNGYHVNAISLCQETNKLFVEMWSDTIKVYQMS